MSSDQPAGQLDARYSDPDAAPTPWRDARARLDAAPVCWLATVRPDGGPHITPLLAVWVDGAPCFCTGPREQKARNLARSSRCALVAGDDRLDRGLDVVLEGDARRVTATATLMRVAVAYLTRYGPDWAFEVRDGGLAHAAAGAGTTDTAIVFRLEPRVGFGFAKGAPFGQTRWRFDPW